MFKNWPKLFTTQLNTQFRRLARMLIDTTVLVFAVLFGGFLLIGLYHTTSTISMKVMPVLYYTLVPTATLFFAVGVLALKDSVHNLLCLIAVFFSTVVLYLYVGAEFLAFLFLIVYVGAIAILFIFVIMLLQIKEAVIVLAAISAGYFFYNPPVYFIGAAGTQSVLSATLTNFLVTHNAFFSSIDWTSVESLIHYISSRHADILLFSETLYTKHSFLFFLDANLLLTAMLGAIILATCATDSSERSWTVVISAHTSGWSSAIKRIFISSN